MVKMQDKRGIRDDQHIMTDDALLDSIVELADLNKDDTVLEIGGGPGNLAKRLAKVCGKLAVVEKDSKYVKQLDGKLGGDDRVTIINGDILKVALPPFNKIVSNTPYSVLQQFFVRLVKERRYNFECAILVVPRGFATKITTQPGSKDFGALSALFMAFYEVNVLMEIGKGSFLPPPRVKSDCIRVTQSTADPQKNIAGYLFRKVFLNEGKKLKNLIVELFWDYGRVAAGKSFTKKEAREMTQRMLGSRFAEIGDRRVAELRNDDFSYIASSIAALLG